MKRTRILWITAGLALMFAGAGCKKKPPETGDYDESGVTEGVQPEMETERVEPPPPVPVTPAIEAPELTEAELASALKDIYFDFDRYDVRIDQRPILEDNARWLLSHPDHNALIEGHCDERGTEEYNLALGDKRANSAKDYLRALGVPVGRMSTISYGEAYPVDPRHNEQAWGTNRRAHFTLVAPKGGSGR